MKIAFHSYQLGERGTEICLYKYAKYAREILGHEPYIISSGGKPTPCIDRFADFPVLLYNEYWPNKSTLEQLVDEYKFDAFYSIKSGDNDNILPTNTKSLAHCVFNMSQPHGTVYAGVCKYLSEKFGGTQPYVHHILEKEAPNEYSNLREELGIPKDAFVLGRHGGRETFDLGLAHNAIKQALEARKDLWFVFLNTDSFVDHERVVYLPWSMDEIYKAKFVNTCDAMIHARRYGEVFSLSNAEFSFRNKPIISWKPKVIPIDYETGHLYLLKDEAVYYEEEQDLFQILTNIKKSDIETKDWGSYLQHYTKGIVMKEFNDVFLT